MVNDPGSLSPRLYHHRRWLLLLSLLIVAIFFLSPPLTILDKTQLIGYAICHQLPARSFHLGHTPLPLCARCTGIFLGVWLAVGGAILLRRYRAIELPPKPILVILATFIGLMGIDGINSYLSFFPGAPRLYEPQNWLRLVTGLFYGLAIMVMVLPVFNQTFWRPNYTQRQPVIGNVKDLLLFMAGGVILILIALWQHPILLYPLAVLTTSGVLLILSLLTTTFILIVTRREGQARIWPELILPLLMGLALALVMIGGMAGLRALLFRLGNLPPALG
jgi:uncharacterized membrane protein